MKRNPILKRPLLTLITALLAGAAGARTAGAQSFRYSLATQQEFSGRRGFKLYFEDGSPQAPRKLSTLRLLLGVADGTAWRFPEFKVQWQWNHDYQVKAVINGQQAELWLDGQKLGESKGGFAPAQKLDVLRVGLDSRTQGPATEYLVQQSALKLLTSRGQAQQFAFPKPQQWPLPLFAFEPQVPIEAPWKMAENESITIEATFRLLRAPDMAALSPFVDRFGQSRHAQWPGKIHSDEEFRAASAEEERRLAEWRAPAGQDVYGGSTDAGWSEKPSGFFRTVQRNGFWWLVSPLGNPCFYIGVDTALGSFEKTRVAGRERLFEGLPPREGEFAAAWGGGEGNAAFSFATANMIRKYGAGWEASSWQQAAKRLKAWGFSGVGKWSGIPSQIAVPAQPVLRREGVPTIGRMPDIFDEGTRATFRRVIEKGIGANKNNPFVIGWSLGNEHDEIVLKSDIQAMLRQPETVAAKRSLVAYALQHIYQGDASKMSAAWKLAAPNGAPDALPNAAPAADATAARAALEASLPQASDADIEVLRRYFADEYYGFIYRTVKEIDPNHLYCGFWIAPGWWENEEDWRLIARHCDVIGYDAYSYHFADERLERLSKEAGKPILCGEFSYPSWYEGQRGYGAYGTATSSDEESGRLYARWLLDGARNPYCVGMHWFQYRDQPLTGRGATGSALVLDEHFAFGLVDITDRPKWDMIEPMRAANLQAARTRLQATQAARGAAK